mmetsp:Transcript_49725/g.79079  ORF Transcript_49725/g.79079 Transcript_49725/m.79079 type:complete len:95 (+) Transcript_49725:49-333(+)
MTDRRTDRQTESSIPRATHADTRKDSTVGLGEGRENAQEHLLLHLWVRSQASGVAPRSSCAYKSTHLQKDCKRNTNTHTRIVANSPQIIDNGLS